jgi:undecaprenyl diphosphate synthase
MCVNYGSRIEIVDAVNALTAEVADGKRKAGSITEKAIQSQLSTAALPDVDLFVRSSGEQRVSNFLLWQSAYAEFVFLDVLWPDFDRTHLWQAISTFGSRSRRFGGAENKPSTK